MTCEARINVNPEDNEQQIDVNVQSVEQSIPVSGEQTEQPIDIDAELAEQEITVNGQPTEQEIPVGTEAIMVSGIASYEPLTDKPSINGVTLEGDKTSEELGIDDAITDIRVNGTSLPIVDKSVDVPVPTKTSELANDSDFATRADIPEMPTKTSELTNDSGFITSADIPEIPTKTSELDNDSGFITSADIPEIPTQTSDLVNDSGFITNANLSNYYTKNQTNNLLANETSERQQADQTLGNQINANAALIEQNAEEIATHGTQISQNTLGLASEVLNRQNADNAIQAQIDALTAASDVVDVVGTYAELQNYDTSKLNANDIVKVLSDSTQDGATTYYRWNGSWSYVGTEGTHYTKAEADGLFVPQTRTINGKALSTDITLDAEDVGALDAQALADYYTKTETDGLLDGKQDTLTAGENITIENGVISASGGGSEPILYSSLGENTDGAMTQKAVREALYTSSAMYSVRIGRDTTASGAYTTTLGYGAMTLGNYATAVGEGATSSAYATAVGAGAHANVENNTAIGHLSSADHANSIAVGYASRTSRANEMSIAQYNAGQIVQRRFMAGLQDGVNDDDAVTVAQLNAVADSIPTLPTIDSSLSTTSTNAVENQAIANALDGKYDKTGGEITGNVKVDGTFTLDIEDEDYDSGISFTRTLDDNLGTTLTLTGYAGGTNYRTLLRNIATPNSDYDAANKKYVDDHILTPVNYLVALDQNGAIDLVSSSLNYATVKSYLTNNTKDVYLDVLWEPSRFYAKAVQDEDTNNGPVNFFGSYSRGGKVYTALFMLDSSDNLTVLHLEPQLTYEKAQAITSTNISSTTEYPTTKAVADYVAAELTPDVVYSDATGLAPLQADVSASIAYQLTNLNLSTYKRLKFHIGSAGSSGTGFKPAAVIELELNPAVANSSTGQYVGSVIAENAADRNRLSAFLVAVSGDKTSIAFARATSLYGTAATNISDSYVKLIEGYKH